ncbi:hypothetical protein [Limisalsivibrio acetivorans]|uniref:hypothetical protein n=1 Tax=Limisalsivibrio acetivorans TaxID=1304888 RepID=UPI0003B4572B|nr:hypothetical protein [Limisalsivibrio acetivorans]
MNVNVMIPVLIFIAGAALLVSVALAVLKTTGVIAAGWAWVLMPFLSAFFLLVLYFGVAVLVGRRR